jgi:hypothetical protein
MVKAESKPVSDKELEEESEIEEVIEKDGAGYGDLQSLNAQPDETNRDEETYIGRPASKGSETYIQERKSYNMGRTDQNKLKNTKLGDHINYYDNGVSGNGIVSKMSGQFIQIFKEDGKFYNININDTFHVSDILINKTWDAMSLEERTDELLKIKAYSPRFLNKTWDQLPRELKDVMKEVSLIKTTDKDEKIQTSSAPTQNYDDDDFTLGGDESVSQGHKPSKRKRSFRKSSIEDGAFGNTGNSPTTGVSTKIPFDATEDYEGQTHATINPDEEFLYEDKKPEVGKEPKPEEVKLDDQGLVKAGEFVYSDNPQGYKLPPKPTTKGYGIKYGVKYINEKEDN